MDTFIKIKKDGRWVDLSIPASRIKFLEYTLEKTLWSVDSTSGCAYQNIEIQGMTQEYSVIALLEYKDKTNVLAVVSQYNCVRIEMKKIPTENIKLTLLYTKGDGECSFFLIDTITDEDIALITKTIQDSLPIYMADDGFVQIEKIRKITGIKNEMYTGADGKKRIKITTTLQSDESLSSPGLAVTTDVIELDDYGYPTKGETDGTAWTIEWQGFENL